MIRRTHLRTLRQGLCALALLAAGCASPQLKKAPAWESAAKDPMAAEAKAGRYHKTMKQMMGAAEYALELEGFLWKHRDDDAKIFMTDPMVDKDGVDNQLQLLLTQEDNGVVSAKWTHFQVIKYKNVDVCLEKLECQSELSDDWNWRLYKAMR